MTDIKKYILTTGNKDFQLIAKKIFEGSRLSSDDALLLYEGAELGWLGILANYVKELRSGKYVFFNRNLHIEPTNICFYQCKFCAYKRKAEEKGSWEFSIDTIIDKISEYKYKPVTEIHIVGGVHPERDLDYYCKLLQKIKDTLPNIHIKAFTAIELDYMIKKSGLGIDEGLKKLKEHYLQIDYYNIEKLCLNCNAKTIKRCSKCKKVYFCNLECQKKCYLLHNFDCI